MTNEHWEIDSSHSEIRFAVRHFMISRVHGRFSRWSGSILVPDGDWERATVNVVVDASSIETGIARRDAHLRSADYFDVNRHPEASFRTRHVGPATGGRRHLVGELTLKGHTQQVSLDLEDFGVARDRWGNDRAGFAAWTAFNRRRFGLTGNLALDSFGLVIGERVDLEIEVEAVRQPAESVA